MLQLIVITGFSVVVAYTLLSFYPMLYWAEADARPSRNGVRLQDRPAVHHIVRKRHQAKPARAHKRKHVRHQRRHQAKAAVVVQAAPANLFGWFASVSRDVSRVTNDRVAEARKYLGSTGPALGLPKRLWCADFMNMVERKTGRRGTGSRLAFSYASYGTRLPGPEVGAIAVLARRGGGHVGIVTGVDASGNPILISGNSYGRRVDEAPYPRQRVAAYVRAP